MEVKLENSQVIKPMTADEEALMKDFFKEVSSAERDGEVERILSCFKLNPYDFLNLNLDASDDAVKKQYRKLSLLVHPDKCHHPRARDAFSALGQAQEWLLDESRRKDLLQSINHAKELVLKDRKKEIKSDPALLAQYKLLEANGVLPNYEETEDFHKKWRVKARETITELEWRRRKVSLRIEAEKERVKGEISTEKEDRKRKAEDKKIWEETREERVGDWRSFMTNKKKKKGGKAVNEIKPPKLKEEDPDKAYVTRRVGSAATTADPGGSKMTKQNIAKRTF
ncbi:hypothetical protein CYMTET_36461 [Cymbomonas tetramitiformis]|uniref:J domain-containing protein n=1 Tax=Cymbomonas tetramitiformis TaxID=36881 RepID=A0AAE0CI86_9CHLO|nr:hypothetical protein CYMTET_36461 [Cymbomonas tetramitiformis]